MSKNKLDIYYDGDCPFCRNYVAFTNLRKSFNGNVSLHNVRDIPSKVKEFSEKGYNLNDGMIAELNGDIYYGADAVHLMTLLSNNKGVLKRINKALFQYKGTARILYPILRLGRAITLKVLGKRKIDT